MFGYVVNYTDEYKELCSLEMRRLFSAELKDVILSDEDYKNNLSPFFKGKLTILVKESHLELFYKQIETLTIPTFTVTYIKSKQDELPYEKRMSLVKKVASKINGIGSLDAPLIGVMYYEGSYYLGYYEVSKRDEHKKLQSYSQSLSSFDARSFVNIATGGKNISIVDPCCGVGTILIEAKSMGYHIDGYEINKGVAWKANRNLEHFGYEKIVRNMDMHDINQHYDVALLDIPYNLYSSITRQEQISLIKKCHEMVDKVVLISFEEFDEILLENQFRILEKCQLKKMKMVRYVYYCEVI